MKRPEYGEERGKRKETECFTPIWNSLFDDTTSPIIKAGIIDCFAKMLKDDDLIQGYIESAGTTIESNQFIDICLQILLKFNFTSFILKGYKSDKKFSSFMTSHKILPNVILALETFHQEAVQKLSKEVASSSQDIMSQRMTPHSFLTIGKTFSLFLEFISAACTASEAVALSNEQIKVIWNWYFTNKFNDEHGDILWSSLLKEDKEYAYSYSTHGWFKQETQLKDFFDYFFGKPDKFPIYNLSILGLSCFRRYFEVVNGFSGRRAMASKPPKSLKGIETLWKIVFEIDNKTLRDQSTGWLVEIYFQTIKSDKAGRKDYVQEFITTIFNRIEANPGSYERAVHVLNKFIFM